MFCHRSAAVPASKPVRSRSLLWSVSLSLLATPPGTFQFPSPRWTGQSTAGSQAGHYGAILVGAKVGDGDALGILVNGVDWKVIACGRGSGAITSLFVSDVDQEAGCRIGLLAPRAAGECESILRRRERNGGPLKS